MQTDIWQEKLLDCSINTPDLKKKKKEEEFSANFIVVQPLQGQRLLLLESTARESIYLPHRLREVIGLHITFKVTFAKHTVSFLESIHSVSRHVQ